MPPISLVSVKRSEVPEYLHASELYLSFDPEETDDELSVPSNCLKRDLLIHNSADLMDLLLTMRYWILEKFPAVEVVESVSGFDSVFIRDLVESISQLESDEPCIVVSVKFGRVDFLEFFAQYSNFKPSIQILMIAAENGHLDCLSYCFDSLRRTGPCCLNLQDWRECIRQGNFECLPFLVENGVPRAKLLALSIQVNSAKCIKFLHDQFQMDCWTPLTVATAAQMDKKKLLIELNELGCPWDESAPLAALKVDAADCLQYLIDQRGIPDNDAFRNVKRSAFCYLVLMLFDVEQKMTKEREETTNMTKRVQSLEEDTLGMKDEMNSLNEEANALTKEVKADILRSYDVKSVVSHVL